jgi:hypothetical protein
VSSLNSRGHVARRTPPRALPSRKPAAQIGEPCPCGEGPLDCASNPIVGSGGSPILVDTCPTVVDMRSEITVNSFASDFHELALLARVNAGNYCKFLIRSVGFPHTHSYYSLLIGNPGFGDTFLDGTTGGGAGLPHPAPGDVIELAVTGTAIAVSINGTPTYSGTATYTGNGTVGMVGDTTFGSGDDWSVDLVTEDYCP